MARGHQWGRKTDSSEGSSENTGLSNPGQQSENSFAPDPTHTKPVMGDGSELIRLRWLYLVICGRSQNIFG